MRRSILLSAGVCPLLVGLVLSLDGAEYLEDRLIQRFSPDVGGRKENDFGVGGGSKPSLRVAATEPETRFSRDSVEAAPDTVATPSFSEVKAQSYTQEEESTPFSRSFVESGSLKYYGAASQNPYVSTYSNFNLDRYPAPPAAVLTYYGAAVAEAEQEPAVTYYGAAAAAPKGFPALTYYGAAAAAPEEFPALPYYGAAKPYNSFPQFSAYRAVPTSVARESTGDTRLPLRSAVEARPQQQSYKLYRSQDKNLNDLRERYQNQNNRQFSQARKDPNHKTGKHNESLSQVQTKSKHVSDRITVFF